MVVSPNVVPVKLVITLLGTVGGEPQETAIIHNNDKFSHNTNIYKTYGYK